MRVFFCLLMLMLLCPSAGLAQESALTAREAFGALPTSIFENTAEGLEDEDKQQLLEEGQSEFWELAGESRDVIVFRALPFRDSGVALRLFRDADDGSAVAAIGTLGTELCTVELWRVDASGRTVPVDVPQEPDIQEFFAKSQPVPDDVNPSVLICLGMGGLRACSGTRPACSTCRWPTRSATAGTGTVSRRWSGRMRRAAASPPTGWISNDGRRGHPAGRPLCASCGTVYFSSHRARRRSSSSGSRRGLS